MSWLERKVPFAVLLLAGLLAAGSLGRGIWNALVSPCDFQINYQTARLILHGENPYRLKLDGTLQARVRVVLGDQSETPLDPDYFPSALLPVIPLTCLPWEIARVVWLGINLACGALLFVSLRGWLRDRAPPWDHLLLGIFVWLAGAPFRNSLGLGQNTIFAIAMLLASLRAADSARPALSGLLLALGLYKYPLVWPMVLFFYCLGPRRLALVWAAVIHLTVHLWLCGRMAADPVRIFGEVLRGNRDIFDRNETFTVWMPWRTLSGWLPPGSIPVNALAALTLVAVLALLIQAWNRGHARQYPLAWFGLLGLLAMISVSSRPYALVFAPAIWFSVVGPHAVPASAGRRWRIAGYVLWLTAGQRLADALLNPETGNRAVFWTYNPFLILLCLEFGHMLWKLKPPHQVPAHSATS